MTTLTIPQEVRDLLEIARKQKFPEAVFAAEIITNWLWDQVQADGGSDPEMSLLAIRHLPRAGDLVPRDLGSWRDDQAEMIELPRKYFALGPLPFAVLELIIGTRAGTGSLKSDLAFFEADVSRYFESHEADFVLPTDSLAGISLEFLKTPS